MTPNLAAVAHAVAFLAHAAFLVQLLRAAGLQQWREPSAAVFSGAIVATALWAATQGLADAGAWLDAARVAPLLDWLRYALWFAFLLLLLRPARGARDGTAPVPLGRHWSVAVAVLLLGAAALALALQAADRSFGDWPAARLQLTASLALAVFGLVLVEQLFRNQADEARWNAKPVCLALACVFGYDLYLYSEAVMFGRFDVDAMDMRGAIHALSTPLLFIATRRHHAWIGRIQVSRAAAFYSAALLLVGGYLLFISAVGYYVRFFGGTWGRALQLGLLFAALALLAALLLSASLRARLRVFLGKNFFSYRYDYRQEWLRFTAMLSTHSAPQEVGGLIVRGLADMIESPAGSLWSRGALDERHYVQGATWNAARSTEAEPADSGFCAFLRDKEWIVDLDEYRTAPKRYGQIVLPRWLLTDHAAWVVVPLIVADEMVAFVVLNKPRTPVELNWEVRDLLKTAARQAAGYLARMYATEALLEARKFDAFNRMSAFVVHDLKNIVTQLSLMMKNAERHRDNPEFQQDMLLTVASSLEKMRQMMLQLREGARPAGVTSGVELEPILRELAAQADKRGRRLELEIINAVAARGHDERLARVLGHVVQNALDATPASGRVWVRLEQSAGRALVVVGDTGAGMTPEFIQNQLFRPFSTTKQSGMGIGTFESFQYVRELGGTIEVDSEVGRGTVVRILLPLFEGRKQSDLKMVGAT